MKAHIECLYALIWGYGMRFKRGLVGGFKRIQRWTNEPRIDEDEFF
jgi:hypothetical protein